MKGPLRLHLRPPAPPDDIWPAQSTASTSDLDALNRLQDRAAFDALAVRDDVPGMLGVREVKFVISDVQSDQPQLHFMNSVKYPRHFAFASAYLGASLDNAGFNRVTYFTDDRRFLVGTIVAYDTYTLPDRHPGLYALEFWPTDPVSVQHVALAYRMVSDAMPFADGILAYHPTGDVQEQRFVTEADAFAAQSIRTLSTTEIFEGVAYNPLNLGVAVGMLRVVTGDDPRPPSATDIVVYETLPNDLPIVAGVLSAAPQTALSHVNLRARQNGIANAYLRDATNHPLVRELIGQPVRMVIGPDHVDITGVTTTAMMTALAARRPPNLQFPTRDLTPRRILPLDALSWSDAAAFGAKAANVAELRRVIDPVFVPDGFAVPFSFYDDFMVANGLYDRLAATMSDPAFQDDAQRPRLLRAFRKTIKAAPMTTPMRDLCDAMHRAFPAGTTPRCRSSANNEDLAGFTGAGLYDSFTHRLDEGHIEKSIKQVWASLWNLRAVNEREFYRIDQMTAAMGVLVHPNFDDERVNGVALTRNPYFPRFEGYFVNAQVGEDRVTNPDGDATAEEVLILREVNAASVRDFETIYIRRSSLVPQGATVISELDLNILIAQLRVIHRHFARLYSRETDDQFAMDVEFKIDRNGILAIKQARPWTG